jgi:anthranilate phosphoribosyltransferase
VSDPIKAALAQVIAGRELGFDDTAAVFGAIMDGAATPAQIGGLLVALRMKGETADELAGAATAMRARAAPLAVPDPARAVDTCGTGGDGLGMVNVSTLGASSPLAPARWSPSTATAPCRRRPARPTCSRPWAW